MNVWQNQNLIKVSTAAASFKRPERVESSDGEFDRKIIEERKDITQGNVVSSAAQLVHNL